MIVPGGGIALDGKRWIACRPGFFLPVRMLSRLFRRLFLEKLVAAHQTGALQFFGKHAPLTNAQAFAPYLAPLRNSEWVVYSKRPFDGPAEVLRYLARYTHRVALSNRRLVALDDKGVIFKLKDYRVDGPERYKLMTLDTHEFIRRFLMHVLPQGFYRIRYYGLFASAVRVDNIARARELLAVPLLPIDAIKAATTKPDQPKSPEHPCPCCGGRMVIIETFERGRAPRYRPTAPTVDRGTQATTLESCSSSLVLNWPRWRSQRHRIHARSCAPIIARRSSHAARVRLTCPRQPLKPSQSTLLLALDPAQIPIAPEPPTRPPIAVSSLGGFPHAGPRCMSHHRHPKTFTATT
jgi:hypothetical protein